MEFDEILIGSGLSALAVAMGLPDDARILVLTDGERGRMTYYDVSSSVPASVAGYGGLGEYWHGVIPTGQRRNFSDASDEDFAAFFKRFYDESRVADKVGRPWLYVPRQPIRPRGYWAKLKELRKDRLVLANDRATQLRLQDGRVQVTAAGSVYSGRRVWLAAGALQTPGLLETSFGIGLARDYADDHAIAYLGLIDRSKSPEHPTARVSRGQSGMWIPCDYRDTNDALLTYRPARFDFSQLDRGIERRAAFGLPAGNAITRILLRPSPGLVAEALFNKFGLFPHSRFQSVFAQVLIRDAHEFRQYSGEIRPRRRIIEETIARLRVDPAISGLTASQRPDLFIPGIHLHHTLDRQALDRAGIDQPKSRILIADPSPLSDIGPEHHSFKTMLAAFLRARRLPPAD